MARGRRAILQEAILFLVGLSNSKKIQEKEILGLKKILDDSLKQVSCPYQQQEISEDTASVFLNYFPRGSISGNEKMTQNLEEIINIVLKIREEWSKCKKEPCSNLTITIHKGGFPSADNPSGFILDCSIAMQKFASNRTIEENESKFIISRDIYDFIQSQDKEYGLEFLNLGSQGFEELPPLTLYEIIDKKKVEEREAIKKRICLPLETPPLINTFIGRKEELRTLHHKLSEQGIILIEGPAGIGKTSLSAEFAQSVQGKYRIFWFTLTEDTNSDMILSHLNDFLIENQDTSFDCYQRDGRLDLSKKLDHLVDSLEKKQYIFFFDNHIHTLHDKKIKTILVALSSKLNRSKLIFTTTRRSDIFDSIAGAECNISRNTMILNELTFEESVELFRAFGIEQESESLMREIIERIGAFPFTLRLLISLVQRHWYDPFDVIDSMPHIFQIKERIDKLLIDKHFNDASSSEKDILILMSVLRRPVEINFIARSVIYHPQEFETKFNRFVDFLVLVKNKNERYSLHPLIKDFCYRIIPNPKFIHKKAAEIYHNIILNENESIDAIIETHYHYFKAKNFESGLLHLRFFANNLIERGLFEPLENEINRYDIDIIPLEDWIWICQIKGEIAQIKGKIEKAIDYYHQMLEASSKIMSDNGKAEGFWCLGNLFKEQKDKDKAVEYYKKCEQIAQRIENKELLERLKQVVAEVSYMKQRGKRAKNR